MQLATSLTSQGQVTIPVSIRKELDLKPSDKVEFIKENDRYYIKPIPNFIELRGKFNIGRHVSDEEIDNILSDSISEQYKRKDNS